MKIVVLMPDNAIRKQFLPCKVAEELLEKIGEVVWNPSSENYSEYELKKLLQDADAVITGWGCPRITEEMLEGSHLRLIAHTGGTVAPYLVPGIFQKGVRVTCCNELYAQSVAEGTLAYILAGLRQIPYWDRIVKNGGWRTDEFQNGGLFGKKVGLTGYGAITKWLIPMLQLFETEILLSSSHMSEEECMQLGVKKAELHQIFSECDIISLHNGLTERTWHMIDRELLAQIKPGALLVNTARGGIIDEEALIEELQDGQFYAVLDVFESEPLAADSPLRTLPNVILIPHMGGPTSDRYAICGQTVAEEIQRLRDNQPLRYEVSPAMVGFMTAKG